MKTDYDVTNGQGSDTARTMLEIAVRMLRSQFGGEIGSKSRCAQS